MADVNDALAANGDAVLDLVAAAERSAATWTTPRAPGKWSPSQVVEHVAGGLEEAANVVSGAPSIPMPPAFLLLRPLARLIFNRTLKKGVFPKGFKAHRALNPTSGPATPAEARVRLEGALARFDQECRRRVASGQHVVSTGFGTVSVEDFVRFNAIHTRHHCKQTPRQQVGSRLEAQQQAVETLQQGVVKVPRNPCALADTRLQCHFELIMQLQGGLVECPPHDRQFVISSDFEFVLKIAVRQCVDPGGEFG